MEQIRIHGRGGQGVVTAAELIAMAAFYENKHAQAFPHFGVERSGAPIRSYARISDEEILTRERVYNPSVLIIQDHTLLEEEKKELTAGIDKNTLVVINAPKGYKLKTKLPTKHIFISPATKIAIEIFGKNIVNTVILGAFAKYSNLIQLESLKQAIKEKFKEKGEKMVNKNIKAVELAYQNKYEKN